MILNLNFYSELERGKRNNPLKLNKPTQIESLDSNDPENGLNIDYKDLKVSAKGRDIIYYIVIALTAAYGIEKASTLMLCICRRLNTLPERRRRQNNEYLRTQ